MSNGKSKISVVNGYQGPDEIAENEFKVEAEPFLWKIIKILIVQQYLSPNFKHVCTNKISGKL